MINRLYFLSIKRHGLDGRKNETLWRTFTRRTWFPQHSEALVDMLDFLRENEPCEFEYTGPEITCFSYLGLSFGRN